MTRKSLKKPLGKSRSRVERTIKSKVSARARSIVKGVKKTEVIVISENEETAKDDSSDPKVSKKNTNLKWLSKYKNIVFGFFWIYFIGRLFITDLDALLVDKYFNIGIYKYLIYRFLFFWLLVFVIWERIGNKRFWLNLWYILVFPVYPVGVWTFRNIGNMIKKISSLDSPYLFYMLLEFVSSFVMKFKRWIIVLILTLLAMYLLSAGTNRFEHSLCILILATLQANHLQEKWNEVFSPITLFQINIEESPKDIFTIEKLEEKIEDDLNKKKAQGSSIDELYFRIEQYIFTREAILLINTQVKKILKTKVYLKNFILKGFYSFFYAIIIFGGINYCLYSIDNKNFSVGSESVGLFEFIYYSFFNIFSEGVDVDPVSRLAKSIRMIGVSVGVVINFLILGVLFTVNSERYKNTLEHADAWSNDFARQFAEAFTTKFSMSLEDGESELKKKGSKILDTILKFRKYAK